jgi:hypothetical protein
LAAVARVPLSLVSCRLVAVRLLIVPLVLLAAGLVPRAVEAQCRVEGAAPAADRGLALAACARAAERFSLLFGVPAPPGAVVLDEMVAFFSVEEYHPRWRIVWPTSERAREFLSASAGVGSDLEAAVRSQWEAVLPHELGHLMLIAAAEVRRPAGAAPRRLPDWLHEGTGVWMEPPATRADEHSRLRVLRPYVPPLEELLTRSVSAPARRAEAGSTVIRTFFPCASEEACGGRPLWSETFRVTTRQFPDGTVQVDTTILSAPPPPPDPLLSNFYAYSATLVRYVFDRGGATAMRALLDRYVLEPDEDPLAGIPGLPTTGARLEADWQAWFRRWVLDPDDG